MPETVPLLLSLGYAQDTTKAGSNSAPATGENLQAAARDHGGPISGADMAARGATNAAAAATKEKASTGGAASGTASDGKPGPNVMDPGTSGGRNNAVYVAAVAALGVAFWWRNSSGTDENSSPKEKNFDRHGPHSAGASTAPGGASAGRGIASGTSSPAEEAQRRAAASGVHEANPSSRVAQAATARTEREAKDLEPDLVVNAILGASLMMVGGALAFRYRLSDRYGANDSHVARAEAADPRDRDYYKDYHERDKPRSAAKEALEGVKETLHGMKETLTGVKEETKQTAAETTEQAKRKAGELAQRAEDTKETAKAKAADTAEQAKGKAGEVAERAKDTKESAKETAAETAEQAKGKAGELAQRAQETKEGAKAKAGQAAQVTKEEAAGMAQAARNKARETINSTSRQLGHFEGTDENGCRVTDGDLISPAEFLLLLSSPDIDPETDVEAMERLAHIMESIAKRSPMASRMLQPVLMTPNADTSKEGQSKVRSAMQVFEHAIQRAEQRLMHSLRSIMGGDTKQVAEKGKDFTAGTKGPEAAAEADSKAVVYLIDPEGNIKRSFVLDTDMPLDEWHVPIIVEEIVGYNL